MQSLDGRARFTTILLIMSAIVSSIAVVATWRYLSLMSDYAPEVMFEQSGGVSATASFVLATLVDLGTRLVCGVGFLMWFYRAHANLSAAGLEGLEYSPGWAVGGFFVPLLNLVRPYAVMKEVSTASTYLADDDPVNDWTGYDHDPRLSVWWGLYITSLLLTSILSFSRNDGRFGGDGKTAMTMRIVATMLDIPSALILVAIVRRISDQQARAMMRREEDLEMV